jgi:hypothetical protein
MELLARVLATVPGLDLDGLLDLGLMQLDLILDRLHPDILDLD